MQLCDMCLRMSYAATEEFILMANSWSEFNDHFCTVIHLVLIYAILFEWMGVFLSVLAYRQEREID